eukprot:gene2156-1009_t
MKVIALRRLEHSASDRTRDGVGRCDPVNQTHGVQGPFEQDPPEKR